MKKFFVIILSAALLLGSFSYTFAAVQDVSDDGTHTRLTTTNNYLSSISTFLTGNLYTRLGNILNSLNVSSSGRTYSIAQRVDDILTWMSPILNAINTSGWNATDKEVLLGMLGSTDNINGVTVRNPYLLQYFGLPWDDNLSYISNGYTTIINRNSSGDGGSSLYNLRLGGTFTQDLFSYFRIYGNNVTGYFSDALYGSKQIQSYTDWQDITQSSTFTPLSTFDAVNQWLSVIQSPVSRLAFVLANDDQIAAREAAADNEAAVIDQFIDPSGAGSASTSDIGSISSASDGFKTNFSTDASASGIWSIFDSSNGNWFSQEIASSLDTSSGTNRSFKYSAPLMSSGSAIKARTYNYDYETPALDKQVNEIMSLILGGDKK